MLNSISTIQTVKELRDDQIEQQNIDRNLKLINETLDSNCHNLATLSLKLGLSLDELKNRYFRIIGKLKKEFPETTTRTLSEENIYKLIKLYNNKLKIYRSFWIGRRCFDFFIPAIGGNVDDGSTRRRGHGLAIEIDGLVHDISPKFEKDQSKQKLINSLGMMYATVENKDVFHSNVKELLEFMKTTKRIYSRDRVRLWRKIYMATILANYPRGSVLKLTENKEKIQKK